MLRSVCSSALIRNGHWCNPVRPLQPFLSGSGDQQWRTSSGSGSSSSGSSGSLVVSEQDVVTLASLDTVSMPRGRGGRSSFSGNVVTVFGASGHMARLVVNQLGKSGCQVIAAYRGEPFYVRHLKPMGDLGQILFCPFDLRDQQSLQRAVRHSNIVINLVGSDHETSNFSYDDVHVAGARAIARAARQCGVRRLLHFSSLNAAERPAGHLLAGGSRFLRSKWHGEQAVREEFPEAVIFRPADFFGPRDGILRRFAVSHRRFAGVMGLYRRGDSTVKQPVYTGDVCRAAVAAVLDRDASSLTYDIVGPDRYLLGELVDWIYRVMRRRVLRTDIRLQPTVLLTNMIDARCRGQYSLSLGLDKLERECVSDTTTGNPTAEQLGIRLTHLADRIEPDLHVFRSNNFYEDVLNEFDPIEPAPTVN